MSNRITVVIDDELLEKVDDCGDDNRSETVRELLEKGLKYDDHIDDRENQIQELERKVSAIQSRREDVTELANYVEREKKQQDRRREATAVQRVKWFLWGENLSDDD